MYRVGLGSDFHRLVKGRRLVLGGLNIPFHKGLLGHSDADVLVHAVIDALLGAMGESDIGDWFKDSDARWKDASGAELLALVTRKLRKMKFEIVNLDVTVSAEAPKLGPYRKKIRTSLSRMLGTSAARVNIKAKSREGLGDIGRGRAMKSDCVVLLRKRK